MKNKSTELRGIQVKSCMGSPRVDAHAIVAGWYKETLFEVSKGGGRCGAETLGGVTVRCCSATAPQCHCPHVDQRYRCAQRDKRLLFTDSGRRFKVFLT